MGRGRDYPCCTRLIYTRRVRCRTKGEWDWGSRPFASDPEPAQGGEELLEPANKLVDRFIRTDRLRDLTITPVAVHSKEGGVKKFSRNLINR